MGSFRGKTRGTSLFESAADLMEPIMKPLYLAGTLALVAVTFQPIFAQTPSPESQTPPVAEMPPVAPVGQAPPVSKLPGAVPEAPATPEMPAPPAAEAPPPPPVEPVQAVSAAPPPPPQAVYPPCTASRRDQCTNSTRSTRRSVKSKPRVRR
jgi:hypothetical protein